MALRIARNSCFSKSLRSYSTTSPLVDLSVNKKTGIATATFQNPPVNSLNVAFLTEFNNTLKNVEKDKCRGLIVTSGFKNVFSAGLDIGELYKPNIDSFKQLWTSLQQIWMTLYGTSYPTAAVINGHAIAGGCVFPLCCEYRIMLNNFKIGLNETQLGLDVPSWLITLMRNAIGSRQTELAITTGSLFETGEALKIGLVDEAVATKEEGLEKAVKFIQRYEKIPPVARSLTKKSLRGNDIEEFLKIKEEEFKHFWSIISSPEVQSAIGKYWESLKQKQK